MRKTTTEVDTRVDVVCGSDDAVLQRSKVFKSRPPRERRMTRVVKGFV